MSIILKSKKILIIFILLYIGVVGNFSASNKDSTYKFDFFSVQLPSNPEWKNIKKLHEINLGRSLDGNPFHTFTLDAREYPEFPVPVKSLSLLLIEIVRVSKKEALKSGRFNLINHTEIETTRLGIDCVEYHKSWVDKGGLSTEYKILSMKAHGLICIHPEFANRLIEISYSTRNKSGEISNKSLKEGNKFINSLKALKIK